MSTINGIKNEQQQIPEWYEQRLGRFSCSQFYRLMTEPKLKADKEAGNLSDGAKTYVHECVAENITGVKAKDDFTSKYTDWGNENEPVAKGIYNAVLKVVIEDSPYIEYAHNAGGSPDGLINQDGVIEIKCPFTITSHLEHKINELKDKPEYYWQCVGYLLITGRSYLDFISYHPTYPGKLQVFRKKILASDIQDDLNRLVSKLQKANIYRLTVLNSIIKNDAKLIAQLEDALNYPV